jgi:cardiolipin synthase A/B
MVALQHFPPFTAQAAGHKLSVAITGADRLAAILKIIEDAKHSLRLFFYIFGHDEISIRVREALIDATNRGVSVCLLVDGFGTAERDDSVYEPLVEAGVGFARFHSSWGRRYLLRNHQKIIVADEKRALVGGTNIVGHYFTDDPDGGSWHDLCLTIEGDAAVRLARYFDALRGWMTAKRRSLFRLLRILKMHSDAEGPFRILYGGPFQRLSPLTRSLKRDLHGTRRLDMVEAYFAPNGGMLKRISRIVTKNGGEARLLTAARSDNEVTIAAARHCYGRLLRGGVQVYEYLPQMLHMKLIVADEIVYIGSANFDMRSLYINAEVMVRIADRGFADQMSAFVAEHLPASTKVTLESHRASGGLLTKLGRRLAYYLMSTVDFTVTRGVNLSRR